MLGRGDGKLYGLSNVILAAAELSIHVRPELDGIAMNTAITIGLLEL